jgi:hypothetical protein
MVSTFLKSGKEKTFMVSSLLLTSSLLLLLWSKIVNELLIEPPTVVYTDLYGFSEKYKL